MNEPLYDVVIVGAGIAGASLACALSPTTMKVLLIDHDAPPVMPEGAFDTRVSCISAGVERAFRALGVWRLLPAERMAPLRAMTVWEDDAARGVRYDSAAIGEPSLGHVIENRALITALMSAASAAANVTTHSPVSVDQIVAGRDRPYARLTLINAVGGRETLSTRLLVAADGADSATRDFLAAPVRRRDYGQRSIVANVVTENHHGFVARQRFLPTGPLAVLPLPGEWCAVVWSLENDAASHVESLSDADFRAELTAASQNELGAVTACGERASFPLHALNAAIYGRHRLALVGDSAHVVHPLAGLGANLGITDALALAELLTEASSRSRDHGSARLLRQFERWRHSENFGPIWAIDNLHQLFCSRLPSAGSSRRFGLRLVDHLPGIKSFIMRRATGVSGDTPRLMRQAAG